MARDETKIRAGLPMACMWCSRPSAEEQRRFTLCWPTAARCSRLPRKEITKNLFGVSQHNKEEIHQEEILRMKDRSRLYASKLGALTLVALLLFAAGCAKKVPPPPPPPPSTAIPSAPPTTAGPVINSFTAEPST